MSDIDRRKKELLGLILGLAEVQENYGYMHAVEDISTHNTYGNEKHMKDAKKEIKIIWDEIKKKLTEL